MTRTITWLHLSDLHARIRHDWDARKITKTLVDDLRDLRRMHGIRPDLVFFTGDAAFGSADGETMAAQYAKVKEFLDAVRTSYNPPIAVRDIYMVPGNHDVDRDQTSPGETMWLRAPNRELSEVIDLMQRTAKPWRNYMDRFTAYRDFLNSYSLMHLKPNDPHLIWADAREIAGVRLGIAGFNSSWSCSEKEEKGKLWWGGKWQMAKLQESMGKVDFSIALIHHPSNWLTANEDPTAFRHLRQDFELVFHGHEHQDWVDDSSNGHIVFSGAACYQSTWMHNGYSVGQINLEEKSARIYLRQWDESGRGWVDRNVAGKTQHGTWLIKELPWLEQLGEGTSLPQRASQEPEIPKSSTIGKTVDETYTRRFCEYVIELCDVLELFGCDIPSDLQRHQLSVTYVSLNLSPIVNDFSDELLPVTFQETKSPKNSQKVDPEDVESCSTSIDAALNLGEEKKCRLMIYGPAGAGKSTLLRWCAVEAARHVLHVLDYIDDVQPGEVFQKFLQNGALDPKAATAEIFNDWRAKIPLLVRLRDCPDGKLPAANDLPTFLAKHLPSAPLNWMTRVLYAGQALVLLDGVDEVHRDQRIQLAQEINELVRAYPLCTFVVTTRPGAVETHWLNNLKFKEARVEPMDRADREEFIDKWYQSAALVIRPRPGEDFVQTARKLKDELTDQPELGILASNPLLCAVICALYRERREKLPETPAELCEALVYMLIHRRERETPGLQDAAHFSADWRALEYFQKKGLLAELAWHMVSRGESSIDAVKANEIVSQVLATTPYRSAENAPETLQALVERSGLLRPAGADRIEFLHNTLKEYLAAGRILEEGNWQMLTEKSDDSVWQPVILFVLALAAEPFSSGLVRELLSETNEKVPRAQVRKKALIERKARDFFLVRCRSVAKRLAPELSAEIDNLAVRLFPPAYMEEVEALASLGPRILLYGAIDQLADPKWWMRRDCRVIARCLRLLRLVGGKRAVDVLNTIKQLPTNSSQVTTEWILASAEMCNSGLPWPFRNQSSVYLSGTRIGDIRPLTNAYSLRQIFAGNSRVEDLTPLSDLSRVVYIDVDYTKVSDLSPLSGLTEMLQLHLSHTRVKDVSPLAKLSKLEKLTLHHSPIADISGLSTLKNLKTLNISFTPVSDLTPIADFPRIEVLNLEATKITDISPLKNLGTLKNLKLARVGIEDASALKGLKNLEHLDLEDVTLNDLKPFKNLTKVRQLILAKIKDPDLAPLANMKKLEELVISELSDTDLKPLANLSELNSLYLYTSEITNFGPLADLPSLVRLILHSKVQVDIVSLARISGLLVLDLKCVDVSDISLLGNLSRLNHLGVSTTKLNDLDGLKRLTALRSLNISETRVSNLEPLNRLTSLRFLDARNTKVSHEDFDRFMKKNPDVQIRR